MLAPLAIVEPFTLQAKDGTIDSSASFAEAEHVRVASFVTAAFGVIDTAPTVGLVLATVTLLVPVAVCPEESCTVAVQVIVLPTFVSLADT